ncbi:hypothetical protein K8I85_09450 [bacterium]|nr:hypothetical protein [bacterium]
MTNHTLLRIPVAGFRRCCAGPSVLLVAALVATAPSHALAQCELAKLTAPDAGTSDEFGTAVDIDGDIIVVGAPHADTAITNEGAAYVFYRNAGGADQWGFVRKISAADGQPGEEFAGSVGVSGDVIVVGCALDDDLTHGNSGSAYVFHRNAGGTDNWGQVKKLTAPSAAANDFFGHSVAVAGDAILVGAHGTSSSTGAAHAFGRNQGGSDNWGYQAALDPIDGGAGAQFGWSVDADQTYAIVSAHKQHGGGNTRGAAYIFERDTGGAGTWGRVAKLTAFDAADFDNFGYDVAIQNRRAVVGSPFDDDEGAASGSVYVYDPDGGGSDVWSFVAKRTASDGSSDDQYGLAVGVHGDDAIAGAYYVGNGVGAAYLLSADEGGVDNWGEVDKLVASDATGGIHYGWDVRVYGSTAAVGARYESSAAASGGAVYVVGLSCGAVGVDALGALQAPIVQALPNPARGEVRMRVFPGSADVLGVRIFDVRGNLVRTLSPQSVRPGSPAEWVWDGVDEAGRSVTAQTYFYEIAGAAQRSTGKLTLVR